MKKEFIDKSKINQIFVFYFVDSIDQSKKFFVYVSIDKDSYISKLDNDIYELAKKIKENKIKFRKLDIFSKDDYQQFDDNELKLLYANIHKIKKLPFMESSRGDSIESPIAIVKVYDTKTKNNNYYILVRYNREFPYTEYDRFVFCTSKIYNDKKTLLTSFVNNNIVWKNELEDDNDE